MIVTDDSASKVLFFYFVSDPCSDTNIFSFMRLSFFDVKLNKLADWNMQRVVLFDNVISTLEASIYANKKMNVKEVWLRSK